MGTGCSNQNEALRNFQNVVDLLQLSKEQEKQLSLSMLGEVNREEKVGIKYRYDQRTEQEIIVIPNEWLEINIASKEFGKESFECFDERACRGNEVQECKKFVEQKELDDRELQLQFEKKEVEKQHREKLTQVDIESKEQRRLQEESRKKFLSKLEKVVTPEEFEYYVDRSSGNDGGDNYLPISDLGYESSDDEEVEFPSGQNELAGCTQEKNSDCLDLLSPEFSSLLGGGEIDMREIESTQRAFEECLAEDKLRANLIEEISTVIEEVPCIVEKRGCVTSRDKEESSGNEKKVSRESNGSVCSVSVSSRPWRATDSQTNNIGNFSR